MALLQMRRSLRFGTSLELSDAATRTITRHELTVAFGKADPLHEIVEIFMDHARDLASAFGSTARSRSPVVAASRLGSRLGGRAARSRQT